MEESWNAKTCLSRQWNNLESNLSQSESQCPPIWDGLSCWGPTPAGWTASEKCPAFKGSDITKSAVRICSSSGEWMGREGVATPTGWTNYTPCLTPEIREIMRRLGSNDEAQIKFNIAENTRILEFVGLSLSLAALLISLLIFYYFRTLRNTRTRLHRHLFIAMVIQVGIRLILYTDQAITRSIVQSVPSDGNNTNASAYSSSSYNISYNISKGDPSGANVSGESTVNPEPARKGIDNTPILCEGSYICLEYARTAMFMWMFVEGLFLHNMITVTVFEEKLSPFVYPTIGWVVPIPLTMTWAFFTHLHYGSATCWWGYNFTLYFWILEGPRLAVLVVNLAFLLNILRVLIMKLRQSNSSETQQALKAVKAALVLLPLLGLTNIVNMLDAPLEKSPFQFALWSYTTHLLTSTQGFILAFLYCFRNGEVQIAVRKFVRIRILGNSKHIILVKKPIPLSAMDNGSLFRAGESETPSCSQTVNMVNPPSPSNMLQNNSAVHPSSQHQNGYVNHSKLQISSNNKNNGKSQNKRMTTKTVPKTAYSSPAASGPAPPPLIVRSHSNGVLKETSIQQQRRIHINKQHHQHSKTSENQRFLRNSSCFGSDHGSSGDGRRPLLLKHLLQKQDSQENPATVTTTMSSSFEGGAEVLVAHQQQSIPITPIPTTSSETSSTFNKNKSHDEQHPHSSSETSTLELFPSSQQKNHQHDNQTHHNQSKRIKISQIANSWRMLIIPEQLLKRMRGQQQTADDLVLSTSSPEPVRGSRITMNSNKPNNAATVAYSCGAAGVVVREEDEEEDDDDEGEAVEQEISTSTGDEEEGRASISRDFVSVDMMSQQDKSVVVDVMTVEGEDTKNKNRNIGEVLLSGINNNRTDDDDDDDDETTVQIAVEILTV